MEKCKYPNEACANMKFFHGNTYCDSVPCVLKEELPKPSNADKIRAMSDLELSNFIKSVHNDGTCREYALAHGQSFTDMFDNKGVMAWLQSEAE